MKNIILLFIVFFIKHNAVCQDSTLVELRTEKTHSMAVWSGSKKLVLFIQEDNTTNKIDTIAGIASSPNSWLKCTGTDNELYFFQDNGRVITINLRKIDNKWKIFVLRLPPAFPLVGIITPGEKYERYIYSFLENGDVDAVKLIYLATDDSFPQNPIEKYNIRYTVDKVKNEYIKAKEELIRE